MICSLMLQDRTMKTRSKTSKSNNLQSQTREKFSKQSGPLDLKMSAKSNKKLKEKEQKQWVILTPDQILQVDSDAEADPVFINVLHPKTEQTTVVMLSSDGKQIHEVTSFKEDFRSWFINQTVQEDGSLKMVTPIDPLFLILPYLRKSEKEMGKFMTLDQIVVDNNYPQCHRLVNCCGIAEMDHCCDVKGDDDLKVFRYNNKKTLEWLKAKVDRTATTLKQTGVHCAGGSKSATFVRSSKGNETSSDDYMRYAAGMIFDYLHPDLSKELFQFMGIKEVTKQKLKEERDEAVSEPPSKKLKVAKTSSSSEPEEDYSKYFNNDKKEKTKVLKMTAGQKALSKVDKTGMKSISSFFSKASKKE